MNLPAQLKTLVICATTLACAHAQLVRQSNTTMDFPAEPVPPASGVPTATDLFGGALTFDHPVAARSAPGDPNHLYVVERVGRIIVVDLNNPVRKVFLDITDRVTASEFGSDPSSSRRGEGLTSFEFHPDYRRNGRFFVTYTFTPDGTDTNWYNRISEFRASNDRQTGLANTEIPYITQFDEGPGHNINDAHFGPDGYLYIPIGDEGDVDGGDGLNNAQKIDKDFFSCIMRIDVDKQPGNLPPNPHPANTQNYWIPADNPFVGATSFLGKSVDPSKVRTEFWAVGFRNPWRISFDPLTGEMYEGDVGEHNREEINHVVKGGNYGWSFMEGTINGPKGPPPAGFTFIPPLWDYSTGYGEFEGMCVIGGVVNRGSRIPELYGHLIFADYQSGNIWEMNVDQTPSGPPTHLFTQQGISGFGYDPRNGDVLMIDHDHGILWRLDVSGGSTESYPVSLSDTGIFSDLASLTPNVGILPYEVNVPFWSDGAIKRRWFSVPDGQSIQFSREQNWTFPPGAIWIKHFDLQMKTNDPASIKRVETRVLVKTKASVYGLSYEWDDAGENALLVPESGLNKNFTITGSSGTNQQTWRFPSRAECLQCHTPAGGFVLGFNTPQMNRSQVYGSVQTNQIAALASAGYLNLATNSLAGLRSLPSLDDQTVSRTYRVRTYLAANCSQCHQPGNSIPAAWDARLTTALPNAGIVDGPLLNNPGGGNQVVVPGDLAHSILFQRICVNDKNRMPPVGSTVLDQQAISLLRDWITQDLPHYQYLSNDVRIPLSAQSQAGKVALSFNQPANRAVLIESAASVQNPIWQLFQAPENTIAFPAQPAPRSLLDPGNASQQYYRLRVMEP
ncbi:MAG TPA: PQQ-dependent sugar dehydrogenase [Verrucomicrobiae bacterium]|jgi:uncharacterized repeat protein (TIGR03806 family)|nr:PQQ-dependent sugar dehydrogenase [Verrucomicrobiae bacterium]